MTAATITRVPLRHEMFSAFNEALDAADQPLRRAAWTGVGTGYAVAFGLVTREMLDRARLVPGALTLHPEELPIKPSTDEEECWASGVLYGYYQGTSEQRDVTSCTHCGRRLDHDLDDIEGCHHGDFCGPEGCARDWHSGGGFTRADYCTYLDGE